MNKKAVGALVAAVVVVLAVGAWRMGADSTPATAGSAPAASAAAPAVSVTTVRAQQRDFDVMLEATGTVTALTSVEIKPQLSSTIAQVHIREGQFVRQGELLFTLDSREQQTDVARAQAQLQKDQAALADAQRQLARSKELFEQNFVSQVAVDTNQTLVDAQRAAVAADRAALEAARVGLSHARIVAPGSGRAGLVTVARGSFVSPSSPPLVTLTQLDPITVAFNLPQRNLPEALRTLRSGGGSVKAMLPEGRGTLQGRLHFVDNLVDAASGTVKVKALFDNKDEKLWPGAFVGVSLTVQTLPGAIVVPQAAIVQGARGRVVYVVEPDNKAGVRPVEVVHAAGLDAVVTGVRPGDRVIVEGRQNVRPGGTVVERAPSPPPSPASGRGGQAVASAGRVDTSLPLPLAGEGRGRGGAFEPHAASPPSGSGLQATARTAGEGRP